MPDDPCVGIQDHLNELWNQYSDASVRQTEAQNNLNDVRNAVQQDQQRLNSARVALPSRSLRLGTCRRSSFCRFREAHGLARYPCLDPAIFPRAEMWVKGTRRRQGGR